jgi:hypothetical protein
MDQRECRFRGERRELPQGGSGPANWPERRQETFTGSGGAFAWRAGRIRAKLPEKM